MPSSSIGGPFGKCFFFGVGVADGVGEDDAFPPDDGEGESAAGDDPDPKQPETVSRRPVRTSAHGIRRLLVCFTGDRVLPSD
jgi:hypothetical protein